MDYIRRLKDELCAEIHLYNKSKYFQGKGRGYASLDDFDISRMLTDYLKTYDRISEADMYGMLNFAIYLHWLR